MLDLFHLPANANVFEMVVPAGTAQRPVTTWNKPRGISNLFIYMVGGGGNGGNGVAGAASTAAGGGGGGSGSQSVLQVSALAVPDVLFLTENIGRLYLGVAAGSITATNTLLYVNEGWTGGNASGATAGPAGSGANVAALTSCVLAGLGRYNFLAGQAGIAGGTTGAGAALTLPTTGIMVTGGTGGAGIGNASSTGFAGGNVTGSGVFPTNPGGTAAGSTTGSGNRGSNGFQGFANLKRWLGGTGGGSSGGAGGSGGYGGDGAIGCGGGGGGGCFTGGTAGVGGKGGPAYILIVAT